MTPECVHDYTPKDMPVCDEAFGASQKMQCTKCGKEYFHMVWNDGPVEPRSLRIPEEKHTCLNCKKSGYGFYVKYETRMGASHINYLCVDCFKDTPLYEGLGDI